MNNNKTIRAKSVSVFVKSEVVTRKIAKYTCPCCKVGFKDYSFNFRVSRFFCDCGQELIVELRDVKS